MYLGRSIVDEEGESFPMVGVLDFDTTMENKKLNLGYRRVEADGMELRGHEFRYSSIKHLSGFQNLTGVEKGGPEPKVFSARDKEVDTKIYRYKNVWASYIHFYWGESKFVKYIFSRESRARSQDLEGRS